LVELRKAHAAEAERLTHLALRSKALWGYDAEFMRACVPALTIPPERVVRELFFVLDDGERLIGMVGLRGLGPEDAELTNMFVEPTAIGHGHGRRLFEHAVGVARARGWRRLLISSDSFAEGFYLRLGAARIGESASDAIPGRMLPLLALEL
jgi:GNAT superfamily N-acetyltransferase